MQSIKNKHNEKLVYKIHNQDSQKNHILILHAFTGKKENKTINFLAKNLPNSIQFDFSGHGESEGKLEEGTISKQLEDIKSIITKLNLKNIILIGNSFSVLTALAFAKKYNSIKKLILLSGRANFLEYLKNNNLTKEFIKDYKKYNPLENIKQLNIPILIVHGEKDEIVPIKDAEIFLKNSKKGKLKIIKNADHRYSDNSFKKEVLDECIKFLK